MNGDRYVVLGVGRPRSEWFRSVSQWATSSALPAEFLKCVSIEELRSRLASGRAHSAVLVDATLPGVDRDLVDSAREAGCSVLVVDDGHARRDWKALGVAAVLPAALTRELLLDALATHAELVGRAGSSVVDLAHDVDDGPLAGSVAAVCGPGGTGASTVASALAEGLAPSGRVVLADLALHAEQAMLHDVRDVVPGIQELVDAHRSRRLTDDEVRGLTFDVVDRGYHLVLGLRRARYWSTLRTRAFDAAFASLRRAFDITICDVTADFEGEDDGGSADVEERNHPARTAVRTADVVFAVGRPGPKGLHALVRVLADLAAVDVPPGRVVPVVNLAPRHPRARAEIAAALVELTGTAMGGVPVAPVFLPVRRIDEAVRDVMPMPSPLPATLAGAFHATVRRLGRAPTRRHEHEPELVRPGSLGGAFSEADE